MSDQPTGAAPESTNSRKRMATSRAERDGRSDDEGDDVYSGPIVADAATMAQRRLVRVRRPDGAAAENATATPAVSWAAGSTAAPPPAATSPKAAPKSPKIFGNLTAVAPPPALPLAAGGFGSFGQLKPSATAFGASSTTPATPPPVVPNVFGGGFSFSFKPQGTAAANSAETPAQTAAAPSAPASGHVFGSTSGFSTFSFGTPFSTLKPSAPAEPTATAVAAAAKSGDADEGDEDPEAEVPLPAPSSRGAAPTLTEVAVDNGEAGDKTIFTGDYRLLALEDGAWKERGAGYLRVNTRDVNGETLTVLILRGAATKQVLLACAINDTFVKVATSDKHVVFTTPIDGKIVSRCLRCLKTAPEGNTHIQDLLKVIDPLIVKKS